MNVGSIWAGERYAYVRDKPKGSFSLHGRQVKAIRCRKVRYAGNTRMSSEVLIQRVHDDGTIDTHEFWVPARDIIDFWDNYSDELNALRQRHLDAEQKAREELEEKRARVAREREEIAHILGLPIEAVVTVRLGDYSVVEIRKEFIYEKRNADAAVRTG